jgi:hypothetical protein
MLKPASFLGGYATCLGCTRLFEKRELHKSGRCESCSDRYEERRKVAMAKADQRSISSAAKKILADARRNKSEPIAPSVIESFMAKVGGPSGFGEILHEELLRARGDIKPGPGDYFRPNQAQTQKLLELVSRIFLANDERDDTSFSSMTDEELINTLRSLAADLVKDNDEFRRVIAIEAVRNQPDLITS